MIKTSQKKWKKIKMNSNNNYNKNSSAVVFIDSNNVHFTPITSIIMNTCITFFSTSAV